MCTLNPRKKHWYDFTMCTFGLRTMLVKVEKCHRSHAWVCNLWHLQQVYRERKCAKNHNKGHNKFIFKTISILVISSHITMSIGSSFLPSPYKQPACLPLSSAAWNQHCMPCIHRAVQVGCNQGGWSWEGNRRPGTVTPAYPLLESGCLLQNQIHT